MQTLRSPDLDQIHVALKCLRHLAGHDRDHATYANDAGFNKADCSRGHLLSKRAILSPWEYAEAKRYVWTYRRQLEPADIEIVYRGYQKPSSDALIDDLGGPETPAPVTVPTTSPVEITIQPPVVVADVPTIGGFEIEGLEFDDQTSAIAEPVKFEYDEESEQEEQPELNSAIDTYDGVKPTDEQMVAVQRVIKWLVDPSAPQSMRLGGYAGTGKTTTIKYLLHLLHVAKSAEQTNVDFGFLCGKTAMVCAFTGKAASVLRKKGVNASTIHSLMYRPVEKTDASGRPTHEVEWRRQPRWELPGNFFIVDEASMISTDIYQDMSEYGLKMLFVGDPGQLEPVGDNPNLMRTPDITLMQIHRQALESPIIKLATDIRNGFPLPQSSAHPDLVIRDKALNSHDLLAVTQVICAKNATRARINAICRQAYGRTQALEKGDKLIITKNNKDLGVYNGMIVYVDSVRRETHRMWECLILDEDGASIGHLPIAKEPFSPTFDAKSYRHPKDLVQADYGYCVTCHKSQGSEWEHVMVIDEWVPPKVWCMKRWRYTAFTRAAKRLTVCRDYK